MKKRVNGPTIGGLEALSDEKDVADSADLLRRLIELTEADRIEWKRGEMITLYAVVGDVLFRVYFGLQVGDARETWREFEVDVRPLRGAIGAYLERGSATAAARALAALSAL